MSAVIEEFISAVEQGPLRLEDHQAFLLEAEPAAVRGGAVGLGPRNQGPGDGEVPVLHQPLLLQAPDVGAEAGCTLLAPGFEILYIYINTGSFLLTLSGSICSLCEHEVHDNQTCSDYDIEEGRI